MGGFSNPFDQPLSSEVQESSQRQAASVKASPNGNPFDEPLASEVAQQKHAEATKENGAYVPNARIRNLPNPAEGINNPGDAFLNGAKTGVEAAAIPASMIGLGEAGPVIAHLAEHLPNLSKAYHVLKTLGEVGAGTGGAVYTLEHLKQVLGIIGGGSSSKK